MSKVPGVGAYVPTARFGFRKKAPINKKCYFHTIKNGRFD